MMLNYSNISHSILFCGGSVRTGEIRKKGSFVSARKTSNTLQQLKKAMSSQNNRYLVLRQHGPSWLWKWYDERLRGLCLILLCGLRRMSDPLWSEVLPAGLSGGSFSGNQCFPKTDQTVFVSTTLEAIWSHPGMLLPPYPTHPTRDLQQSFSISFASGSRLYI